MSSRSLRLTPGWAVAAALAGAVVVLAALPPWLGFEGGANVRAGFAAFCHQIVERSPHAHGTPFALCHRCFGVVAGLAAGVLAGPLMAGRIAQRLADAPRPLVLLLAALPTAADWLLGVAGLLDNTGVSRLATGAVFGLVAGFLLARALLDPARPPSLHPTPL